MTMNAASTVLLIVAITATGCWRQAVGQQPDSSLYVEVQNVGSQTTGTFRPFYGCGDNGATLSSVTVWANAQFVRGLSATLTDGRTIMLGCVTVNATQTGCNETSTRSANFTFQPGETVTSLTLWPGLGFDGPTSIRAGALNLTTSKGRVFDFGMNVSRSNPVKVNVGSGIPCGIAPRTGADIDALGFVFLLPVSSATLQGIYYFGLTSNQGGINLDTAPSQSNATDQVLSSQVYNNSGKSEKLVATFSSQQAVQAEASWTTAPGLDSYLQTTVKAGVPQINGTANTTSWTVGPVASHNRSEALTVDREWNYTLTVGPGGISKAVAEVVQGSITTSFTANLTVQLQNASLVVPVMGTFEGLSTSAVGISVVELQAATQSAQSSSAPSSSGGSNSLAWALGVVFGILGGLLFAVLIAWAVVLAVRRRKRNTAGEAVEDAKKQPSWFVVTGESGNGKGSEPSDNIKAAKDVELGSIDGSAGEKPSFWGLKRKKSSPAADSEWSKPDAKLDTVVGVPAAAVALDDDAPSASGGRTVVPYSLFQRLRLESIKHALRMEKREQETEQKEAEDRSEGANPALSVINESPGLSAPPSGTSTPRAVAAGDSSVPFEKVLKLDDKALVTNEPADAPTEALPKRPASSGGTEAAERSARSLRLKDRVAAIMASRKNKRGAAEEEPAPGSSKSSDSKEASALSKMVSSFTSRSRSSIQHDDHIINLQSRPKSSAAPSDEPPPAVPQASSKPTTPKRPKTVEHEDKELRLGQGYEAPPDARSIQKDTIDMENKRIKLGDKYQTQGRNE